MSNYSSTVFLVDSYHDKLCKYKVYLFVVLLYLMDVVTKEYKHYIHSKIVGQISALSIKRDSHIITYCNIFN